MTVNEGKMVEEVKIGKKAISNDMLMQLVRDNEYNAKRYLIIEDYLSSHNLGLTWLQYEYLKTIPAQVHGSFVVEPLEKKYSLVVLSSFFSGASKITLDETLNV